MTNKTKSIKTRYLKISEKKKLQNFIQNNYNKNHVLAKDHKMLEYYFLNKQNKKLNFVGSFLNKKLIAVCGILPNKFWDKKLPLDITLSLWINKKKNLVSGLEPMKYIINKIKPKTLYTVGINENTSAQVFNLFGKIDYFDHYYISNPLIKPKVSSNLKYLKIKNLKKSSNLTLYKSKNLECLPSYEYYPKKSIKYFKEKYIKNPYYNYFFLKIKVNSKIKIFFVCREIFIKKFNRKILRIVDFYGNFSNKINISNLIINYLKDNKYEYIDLLIYGLPTKIVKNFGFQIKNKNQIIPNYFEPFNNINAKLRLAIIIPPKKAILVSVKADSDQERPNIS